jgi:hypothetical protein
MLASQGFSTSPVGDASAYASQAEKKISYYKDSERRKRPKLSCWGCGGDHSWMKKGKVVRSHGMDPQVIKATDQQYTEFKDVQAKHGNKSKGKGKQIIDYKDPDKKLKKKMHETILAMMAEDSSREKAAMAVATTCISTPVPGPAVFMLSTLPIPVFNITLPPRHMLPVPIHAALLYITLQLGCALGCSNCPAIRCVVETAAALMTGNLHFFTTLAKAYPHTVTSIHSPLDYSPITSSCIVQQGGASITTDLSVSFQFNLPYLTRKEMPTNLVVAAGRNVPVNIILGLPFITQTTELQTFDNPPFPIDFRHAMCNSHCQQSQGCCQRSATY